MSKNIKTKEFLFYGKATQNRKKPPLKVNQLIQSYSSQYRSRSKVSKPKQLIQQKKGKFSKSIPYIIQKNQKNIMSQAENLKKNNKQKKKQQSRNKESNEYMLFNENGVRNSKNKQLLKRGLNEQEQERSLQLLRQAKVALQKIKSFKHEAKLVQECEQIISQIQRDKNMAKYISRIFKIINLTVQNAKRLERYRDQEQTNLKASQASQQNCKLFLCKILYEYEDYQQYLLQIFLKQYGKISKTELIYRYDIYNKANIHNYIDNKPNLLFIIQTQQDYMIAAYTEAPFQSSTIPNSNSFIVSLTNQKYFPKIQNKKSFIYDPIYVAFGNSDLRIKGSQLFSNLGVNNSSYESRGERCHSLFGQGTKNTTVIKQMQVFQVFY